MAEDRKLTDADIEALSAALHERIIQDFYRDLGRGLWAWFWKAGLLIMISIAAYGGLKGIK
ncbi:MAG: hypothetical protein H3C28_15260 [Sphingomonadales bacterium]|nr:hypothetical protein [Sphingomonadales bacterium]RIK91782.1 MAG: hypothetical protein DCC73_15075 [Pseudomonadota bacterium]